MIPIKPSGVIWTDEQWKAIYLSGKNIIVSAGAGSGKTAVLTERIIEKLKSGISINNIIILTFTNAAAFEMRERVRAKIEKVVKTNPELKKQLYLIDQAIITTFDSYSLSLVKKYHYLLGIPKDINIIDNVLLELKKEEILDKVLDKYYENEDFLDLLNTYTIKDDTLIRNSILNIITKTDKICDKREYFKTYTEKHYNMDFINDRIKDYLKLISDTRDIIMDLFSNIKNTITNEVLIEHFIKIEENIDGLNYAKKYEDYKKIIDNYKIPSMTRSKKVDQEEIEEIKKYYDKFKYYYEDLKSLICYQSVEEIEIELLSTKKSAKVMIEILECFDKELFEFKLSKNSYEFSDITRLAIDLLENNPDIRNEIKYNTNEIMIDEYQDTNDIGDYFISLISNNNVYMVGDVKQSIYRFRNANPKIFMKKYNDYKLGHGGYALDLNKNFRSREEVLTGINEIFNSIMNEEIGGANYKLEHNMIYGNKSYIEKGLTEQNYNLNIYNYYYKDTDNFKKYTKDEIEAFIIADDIIKKIENKEQVFNMKNGTLSDISYKDFVILVDRKSKFELFKQVFDYKGIPLVIHKDEEFVYSKEIYVLKNILKLIYMIGNNDLDNIDYPFASVARSYLFDYEDSLIFESIANKDILNNQLFSDIFDKITELVEISKMESISNLLIEIYKSFDFYMKSIKIGNIEITNKKLDYIINVVSSLEKNGYGLIELIEYFNQLFDKKLDIQFSNKLDTNTNSVNIMTIHKSKGLEYPICYFPHLYKEFNKTDLKDKFLFDEKLGIIIPIFKERLTNTIYKRLLINSYIKEDISERLRVLYVGLTRAKEKIIMINPIKENSEDIEFNELVPDLEKLQYKSFKDVMVSIKKMLEKYIVDREYNVDKNYEKIKNVDYDKNLVKTNKILKTDSINLKKELVEIKKYSHIKQEITKEKEMDTGTNIHEILEYLDFKNYKLDLDNYKLPDYFKNKIEMLFTMPFMKDIKTAKIYKELEFFDGESNGIIDLVIENDNKIIVVDYKLKDINNEIYCSQINGYINYLSKIKNKNIEGYLYSIIDSKYKKIT